MDDDVVEAREGKTVVAVEQGHRITLAIVGDECRGRVGRSATLFAPEDLVVVPIGCAVGHGQGIVEDLEAGL